MAKEYLEPMKPLIEEFMTAFRIQEEEHVMRAVADVGIAVDKQRLIKALEDAKSFYEEGYKAAAPKHGHWIYFIGLNGCKQCKCSECLVSYGNMDTPYCPNCGAKMDEEVVVDA